MINTSFSDEVLFENKTRDVEIECSCQVNKSYQIYDIKIDAIYPDSSHRSISINRLGKNEKRHLMERAEMELQKLLDNMGNEVHNEEQDENNVGIGTTSEDEDETLSEMFE